MPDFMRPSSSIVFRADGNAQIGLGHIMRCLALADILRTELDCRFAISQPSAGLTALFAQKQFPLIALQTPDPAEFLSVIHPDDVVILDGYSFDEPFQRAVRAVSRRLVFIDDLVQGHQVADIIINHTAGIGANDYDAESYTRFLLGPAYALVNPIFTARDPAPASEIILVNLGGADPMNVSHQIVNRMVTHHPDRRVRVILGGANPHRESFTGFPPNQITILSGLSVTDMAHEIELCRLAIVSCSTISYEVATVGRPFIGVLTADNQTRLAHFLAGESLAIGVLSLPLNLDRLSSLINQSTPGQGVVNQRHYLDGQAGERFLALFRELLT